MMKAGPSYDLDILSEVQDHDHYQDAICEHREEHEIHDDVQPNYVVDSHADYTSNSNMISYDQYVKDNAVPVVQSNVSSVTNDAYMMIYNDMCEPHDKHFEGIQKALTKKVKEMKEIFEELEAEVDQHVIDRKHDEIERKNFLIVNDNLIVDCLFKDVLHVATNSELNVSSFTKIDHAYARLKARCLELVVELSNLHDKIQKDNHDELIKRFSNLEVNHLNLQLKYQNLKESFGNDTSPPTRDVPDFDSVFVIEKMKASIQGKDNAIKKLRMQISQLNETRSETYRTLDFRTLDFQITQLTKKINVLQEQNELFGAENGKIKQHYKELYDSIKITRAKHLEQTTALLTENESLKVQIHNKLSCVNKDQVKPKVLAPGKYAIDVEPIPPRNRNNREVHLVYLKHLKESELLEYVIGTCPKALNTRDNKHASTSLPKEKQVTFEEQCAMSKRVNSCTDASRSQPRSNTKKNRILPAKSVNMKKVEEHPRTIKSSLKTTNRVDSSISSKRTLRNFVKTFTGTVRFENDHFGDIMGYVDYVIGDSVIFTVYYVEGLGHNLFSIGQFCDSDLEVAFRKHSYMMKSSPICLLSKASKNKSWLWHRHLNHLNFSTINDLVRKDLVRGLPRLNFEKDHLCSACQLGKSKKRSHTPKIENTNLEVLNTLHMDLCGQIGVQTINRKKYILVIVDDYSRFTWVKFLRSKDETPEFVIKFLKQIQVGLNKTVRYILSRTPQQNDVVERRNRTLVEAARIMLIISKNLMFLWAEAVVFGALCYPTNDSEDLGKLQPIANIGIFVGYEQEGTGPTPTFLMPGQISSGLIPNPVPAAPYVPPTNKELETLFQLMFNEYLEPPRVERPVSPAPAVLVPINSASTPSSATID
ncbi:retrovirus-related pol polyprotein from transposon TNT 1-94, partial [Tanacetum coccineum]